jgi:hypothetical protein
MTVTNNNNITSIQIFIYLRAEPKLIDSHTVGTITQNK